MSFNQDDKVTYLENTIEHESAGGFVFFEDPISHELFVALLRKTDGKYFIPKGHLRTGEKAIDAAVREIKEELTLNCNLEAIHYIGTNNYSFTFPGDLRVHNKIVYLYVFKVDKLEQIKPITGEEIETTEWISFNKAIDIITFDRDNLLKARQLFYYHVARKQSKSNSISIAIPTHNGASTIGDTLLSVEEALKEVGLERKEIVICLDHCIDNTQEVIDSIIGKFLNLPIRIVTNQDVRGKTNALNRIYEESKGDIFCIVDDDVILDKQCLKKLFVSLVGDNMKSVFSAWKRLPLKNKNLWRRFWHWILGIKFDIEPKGGSTKIMRGSCLMMRRDDYIRLPYVFNEDQFIQYIYFPRTMEITEAVIYFNSVSTLKDYYKRFVRIIYGSIEVSRYIAKNRILECQNQLTSGADEIKLQNLGWSERIPYTFYIVIRSVVQSIVRINVKFNNKHEWFRYKQN